MHLEKNPNGNWYCRYKQNGRWLRTSLRTKSKRQAQHRLNDLDLSSPKTERLAQAVLRWLKEQETRDISPKHYVDLRHAATELSKAFGSCHIGEIRRAQLLPWFQEQPRRLRLARAFFRWCVAEDLRQTDPCLGAVAYLEKKEVKRTPRLPDTAIEALLRDLQEHCPKLYPLVLFLSETGVRSVDATRLRWKDVLPGRCLIRPGQGKGHTRFIPATIDLPAEQPDTPVFGLSKTQLEGAWRRFKLNQPAWKGTSLHSLRVAVNSRLVEQGQEALARAMLGHSSVDMTAHYTRLHSA
jgi:integrase